MSIINAVKDLTVTEPILPVSYITEHQYLVSCIKSLSIPLVSLCPMLQHPATYYFYGAPFYRLPTSKENKTTLKGLEVRGHAIGFLLPPSLFNGIKTKVYPFDTGAKAKGRYGKYLPDATDDLDRYGVDSQNSCEVAAKLTTLLFNRSNFQYVRGQKEISTSSTNEDRLDCVNTLIDLFNAEDVNADGRRQAFEIISFESIKLSTDDKVVVILPHYVYEDYKSKQKIDSNIDFAIKWLDDSPNIEVIEYFEKIMHDPTSECDIIYSCAVEWMTRKGLLQHTICNI